MRVGIVGYGNLGKACESILLQSGVSPVGVFTRRDPKTVESKCGNVYNVDCITDFVGDIDVLLLCVGSQNDIPLTACRLAKYFNTVDSYDNHAKIPNYYQKMNEIATQSGHLSFVGMGWDPGVFSLFRGFFKGVLPCGNTSTFWGEGVSQGHSEAVRRIDGVKKAVQYTVPYSSAIQSARQGNILTNRQSHKRVCYVVAERDFDKNLIETRIKTMPDYFLGYETEVFFVEDEEFDKEHSKMPHGGIVLRNGHANSQKSLAELHLVLDSNPDFTSSVMVAYCKALIRAYEKGERGAKTILQIPIMQLLEGKIFDIINSTV